ncbi:hypothetical protein ACFFOS_24430 [Nocardioides kongjuensis]|uniref:Cupin domain-containing protein n=1 Tax=Nocardioides kongjuensis TaxID=349522 RepID=A0A852RRY0_9ACTN|nr:hypothetical protein [Nocardioides kongjuensis]NYD33288.1 hypothetical protein [Nocardioides kongjuensis]
MELSRVADARSYPVPPGAQDNGGYSRVRLQGLDRTTDPGFWIALATYLPGAAANRVAGNGAAVYLVIDGELRFRGQGQDLTLERFDSVLVNEDEDEAIEVSNETIDPARMLVSHTTTESARQHQLMS